jgi:hypothetical protein
MVSERLTGILACGWCIVYQVSAKGKKEVKGAAGVLFGYVQE